MNLHPGEKPTKNHAKVNLNQLQGLIKETTIAGKKDNFEQCFC